MPFSLSGLALYFLKLGTIGFGGPVALVGHMHHDLVDRKGWYTEEEYVHGLAFSQLSPGPVATQLAMYLAYTRCGIPGATLIAIAFILPSFVMVLALGAFYKAYGDLSWVSAVFYGIAPTVLAIIARSAYKLARNLINRDALRWLICAFSIVITVWLGGASIWLFIGGGFLAWAVSYRKGALGVFPILAVSVFSVSDRSLPSIFLYFFKAGFIVFGSGLAIVPFLRGGVVLDHHWMTDRQFVDAVAVAMITPGPAVITVAFIGYFVRGIAGAAMAALGVFLPVYLFVVILAPVFDRYSSNTHVKAFVGGVTAAAIGAMVGAILLLTQSAIVDIPTIVLFLVSLGLLFRFKVPEVVLIVGAAIVGVLLHG